MLDPDDPRPPYRQVANHLRAAILTGEFKPGDQLPTGGQLSEMYGVARMTVQKAIQLLRKEDLIVSRQGSGVFVKGRATRTTGLRPELEAAFEADEVTIDFLGHTGEALRRALADPLDKVRRGRYTPQLIRLRAIAPDTERPWALPCRATDGGDEPAVRAAARTAIERNLATMVDAIQDLEELGLVPSAAAEVRTIASPQLVELCLINERELFLGLNPVGERPADANGDEVPVLDLLTKDTALFHHRHPDGALADTLAETSYVAEVVGWFQTIWDTVSQPRP